MAVSFAVLDNIHRIQNSRIGAPERAQFTAITDEYLHPARMYTCCCSGTRRKVLCLELVLSTELSCSALTALGQIRVRCRITTPCSNVHWVVSYKLRLSPLVVSHAERTGSDQQSA